MLWSELPKNLTFCMLGKISPPRVMYGLHTLGPVGNQQPQYPPILRDQGMKANHVRCRLKTVSHSGELLQKWNTFHLTHSWSGLEYKHLHWLKYRQPACSFIALLFWEKLQWICIPFTNSVGKSTLDQFVELSVGEDSCQSSKLGWTPIEQQS